MKIFSLIFAGWTKRYGKTGLLDFESVDNLRKLRTVYFICLFISIIAFLAFFVRFRFTGFFNPMLGVNVTVFTSFFLVALYTKKFKRLRPAYIAFQILALVLLPMAVSKTGGANSHNVFIYLAHVIVTFSISGLAIGALLLVGAYFSVFLFAYAQSYYGADFGMVAQEPVLNAFLVLMAFFYATIPALFLVEEEEIISEELREYESERSGFLLMRRLNHEIGNSLNIALGFLQIAKEENNPEYLKKVEKSSKDIIRMVEEMVEAGNRGNLIELVKEHKDAIAILEELEKDVAQEP